MARPNAEAICAALQVGDLADWKVPRRSDLETLVGIRDRYPRLPAGAFPPEGDETVYWTNSIIPRCDKAWIAMSIDDSPAVYHEFQSELFSLLPVRWFNGTDPREPESQEVWPASEKTALDGELEALKHIRNVLLAELTAEQVRSAWPRIGEDLEELVANPSPGEMNAWENGYFWTIDRMYRRLDEQAPGTMEAFRRELRLKDRWLAWQVHLEDLERRLPELIAGVPEGDVLGMIAGEADPIVASAQVGQQDWARDLVFAMLRRSGLVPAPGEASTGK